MINNPICRVCKVELNDENWSPSQQKSQSNICKECDVKKSRLYAKANPEKARAIAIRASRKRGVLPMSDNKECSQYFGIYINERLLKHFFNDVEAMPMNNPGYDFICNNGWKIDGKASCLRKDGRWAFDIRRNTITDYFFCVAYDNRTDLNIIHIWLIPGDVLNHLMNASIRPSTLDKWSEYEQPIDKVITCCDSMKEHRDPE